MKHHPGPWRYDHGNLNVYAHGMVAQVYGHMHNGERVANAALIASAPDLLEALKNLTDHAKERYPHFESERGLNDIQRAMDAIAKAEGIE